LTTVSISVGKPDYPNYKHQAGEVNVFGRVGWAAKRL
jgi:hypothetical protein